MPIWLKAERERMSQELPLSTSILHTSAPPMSAVMTMASECGKLTPLRSESSKVIGSAHRRRLVDSSVELIERAYFLRPELELPPAAGPPWITHTLILGRSSSPVGGGVLSFREVSPLYGLLSSESRSLATNLRSLPRLINSSISSFN